MENARCIPDIRISGNPDTRLIAPGVYGLMVGCVSTNDLTLSLLSPPHVTGSGYWYKCMIMCFANALTDHEGFAMCPQPLLVAIEICG